MTKNDLLDVNHLLMTPPPAMAEVLEAVKDPWWQEQRLWMKGKSTHYKIGYCEGLLIKPSRELRVQIHNYIGALKRGGQISADGRLVR